MQNLFEYSDRLNSPYEGFTFYTNKNNFPIRPHWHYFMEIIHILNGTIKVECDETIYELSPGDVILFYPRVIHSIYSANDESAAYNVIKFDLNKINRSSYAIRLTNILESARHKPNAPICFWNQNQSNLAFHKIIAECIQEIQSKEYGYDLIIQSKLTCMLLSIIRLWRKNGFPTDQAVSLKTDNHSILTITEYIDEHSSEPLLVNDLAARCNMSYSYFAKNFSRLYGQSCKEYIEFIRVSKAEDLLLFTHFDLTYISQETGFSDCSHFIKAFKKRKGITPKQYRKSYQTI